MSDDCSPVDGGGATKFNIKHFAKYFNGQLNAFFSDTITQHLLFRKISSLKVSPIYLQTLAALITTTA